ncbi:MAG: nucleotidyltransferase domain-containing protein [Actinobacteria bacterium]|jgi:predicted nucleotidyltransferase|nr:nucleotidyltransferase domain-containing protein [Actinomycetota bacterium]MCL6104216.1 nucleotidyltransferase domain-containing protein [Actinomycetota bacterium]
MNSSLDLFAKDEKKSGASIRYWMPTVVHDIVENFHPLKIIAFGSVVRGDMGLDSDLDLLVIFDKLLRQEVISLMGKVRRAITAPIPCDVIVADIKEFTERQNVNGSMMYWPAHEGEIVYERTAS